jgi:hypothetical protein
VLSFNNSTHSSFHLQRTGASQSLPFSHFTSLGQSESYALSLHPIVFKLSRITQAGTRDVLQIIHCSLYPRLDVLRQCCSHFSCSSVASRPRCTRRTLLTSDLVFARQAGHASASLSPPISERAAGPASTRKFLFLGLVVREGLCQLPI